MCAQFSELHSSMSSMGISNLLCPLVLFVRRLLAVGLGRLLRKAGIRPGHVLKQGSPIVIILDGNLDKGAHIRSNLCHLILIRWREDTNSIFFGKPECKYTGTL